MGVIKFMAVGKSGVGKSTIGNCLIDGDPTGKSFATSPGAESCTQDSKWVLSKDVHYCDLPGIPDTNPRNTKKFYDILIEEARKELNVILFVFKYERIDIAAYSKAKMLFRELKKAQAMNVLIINDMTNYTFGNQAKPDDYSEMAESIKACTGLSFTHVINMTGVTMLTTIDKLKVLVSKTKAYGSPNLKTYDQLKTYVAELFIKKNYEEVAYNEAMQSIAALEETLNSLEDKAVVLASAATVASGFSWLTFGVSLGIATPAALAAASAVAVIEMKKKELREARNSMSKDKLEEATKLLEEACKSFQELDNALNN